MALSQVQCLDENHVNPRTHESKPEFLYCEDQRLALEALLRDGRGAFGTYLCARGLRGFLSDPEQETLARLAEPYDPGSELLPPDSAGAPGPPLSLQYWPELSDTSVPQIDLSWPDDVSYRGVTRTAVYAQPPLEGQVHIKEVVRKMIAQAQKVIAVVMDVFTDVDIFRDLLDAGFKRKVSVYILLERTTLPHFQSMCQRANMHAGHLKNLRVRCSNGADFYSRSCTKVRGRMGHRFMFIDGDKAMSGSYSFTWMSSRLDKSLITVITGQAVEAFDRLFRILYATSSLVDLRQVTTEPEPELEPLPQPVPVAAPSAAMARRLYSPKYAMLALSTPVPSTDPKETQDQLVSKNPETKKGRRSEPVQEDPPIHPGLTNLEKVCMMSYLPTWPEPDPPSDVIGFINIRDHSKTIQNHLQRSEMFETSQAIRFSSPFSMPKETLPEVAKLREVTGQHGATKKLQPPVVGGAQPAQLNAAPVQTSTAEATGPKLPASGPRCDSDTAENLNAENKQRSNTPDAGSPSRSTPALPGSKVEREAGARLNARRDVSREPEPACADSRSQAVPAQTGNSREMSPSARSPTANDTSSTSTSVSSLSENSHVSTTTSDRNVSASSPSSSSSSPPRNSSSSPLNSSSSPSRTSSSTTPNPPLPSSSSPPPPPVPKPRTVQLVIKGGVAGESQELPEFSVFRKPQTSTGVLGERAPAAAVTSPGNNVPATARKDAHSMSEIGDAPQQKQSGTSRETKSGEADGRHERAAALLAAGNKAKSDVLITDAPKADGVNIQEIIPTDVESKTLMSTDYKLTPQIERAAAVRTEMKASGRESTGCESPAQPNERRESESESKSYLARAHVPQRISYSELTPNDACALEMLDSLKAPVSSSHAPKHGADARGPRGHPSFTPNAAKHNAHSTFQEQIPKAQASAHTPSDTRVPDFRSPTSRTPTPDGFLPRTPTPDSRTHTPDFHSPGFRTPTPDGYISPRTNSAQSNNSEEFYECSDSPFHEPSFDRASLRNPGATEDYVGFTHANTPNATGITKDRRTFGSETESLSSLSSLKGKMAKENIENGREEDEDSTGTEEENKEAQGPKRKRVLNQSAAEKPVDAGATPGESTNERTGPKRLSTGDLQPRRSSTERKGPDREKTVDRPALGPSGAERRDTDGQKLYHTLPRERRGQQWDSDASSPSRPSRPPRPLSSTQAFGPQPWGSRQPNQAESKVFHDGLQSADGSSSHRRTLTAGRKQDDAAQSQQGRTRAGPPQSQHPFPKAEASQSQTALQEGEKSPFSFTLSKLYGLKGLRDKLPAQSKGGHSSSPAPGRKSTS